MRKRYLSALIVIAFLIAGGLLYAIFGNKAATATSSAAFDAQFQPVNQLLPQFGISTVSNEKSSDCGTLDGDRTVRSICSTGQRLSSRLSSQAIEDWQAQSVQIVNLLEDNKWQKQPNLDPVTQNPVDTLPRLLEYKGVYPADVSYIKYKGTVRCNLRFELTQASGSQPPLLRVDEGCSDIR